MDTQDSEKEILDERQLKELLTNNIRLREKLVGTILERCKNNPDNDDIQSIVKLLDSNDKVSISQLKIKSDERQNKLGRESALLVANALKQMDMRNVAGVRSEPPALPKEIDITDMVVEEDFIGVKTFSYDEIMEK